MRKQKGKRTIECKFSYEDVDVTKLLHGVFAEVNEERQIVPSNALRIFLAYSHKDEELKNQLDSHLSALKRSNKIKTWNDWKLQGGDELDDSIKKQFREADIILLLLSSDFMSSEYIWNVEVKAAIGRHRLGETKVIPIFLRACDFKDAPFAALHGYPKDAQPLKSFSDTDEAFLQIATGIRRDIEESQK